MPDDDMEQLDNTYRPRLFGNLVYGNPNFWAIRQQGDDIAIVPVAPSLAKLMWGLSICLCGGIAIYWALHRRDGIPVQAVVAGIAVSLVLILADRVTHAIATNNLRKGPYFTYNASEKIFALPRQNLAFPKEQTVGWALVHGSQVGPPEKRRTFGEHIAELQLVVRLPLGEVAYPLAGDLWLRFGVSPIQRDAEHIAAATQLRLDICKI